MNIETARGIVQSAKDLDLDLELYEGYSGRGMYGEKTTGIRYSFLADLLVSVANYAIHSVDLPGELQDIRTDNLSTGYIIY